MDNTIDSVSGECVPDSFDETSWSAIFPVGIQHYFSICLMCVKFTNS